MALVPKAFTTSGTTVLRTGAAMVGGFSARNTTAATDNVLTVFDNTAGSGTVLFSYQFPAAGAADSAVYVVFEQSVRAGIGVTATLTGTTPNVVGSVYID